MTIAAKPTLYEGNHFRSRLEARWAAFFDIIGWQYTYEPFDGHGYIPDFLITGPNPLIVEVKPAVTKDEYWAAVAKVERGIRPDWTHSSLVVGASPLPSLDSVFDCPAAGLITGGVNDWGSTDVAGWFTCAECDRVGVFDTMNSYQGRPCGHYDGDAHLGPIDQRLIGRWWADAGREVRWTRP